MNKLFLTGAESFKKIIAGNYFYVDKSLFIKELLENRGEVTLITRPRRFGKSLNMSMLEHFFDVNMDSMELFEGLGIMRHSDLIEKHMNKYPVAFLTLKNVEQAGYGSSIERLKSVIAAAFRQYRYLYESDRLDQQQKEVYHSFLLKKSTEEELGTALLFLTECLYAYHGKGTVVLLDEYDAPLTNALYKGFYEEMLEFMRSFMGSVFKSNKYLEFGVLTGVQRVSKEGLASSFNNPLVCGIMDKTFAACFGFTESEVEGACRAYGLGETYDDVKRWYDGYRFGGKDMYNPWSITGYLREKIFDEYWVSTGSVDMFKEMFLKGDTTLKNDVAGLIAGIPVMMYLEDGITYPVDYNNPDEFWTLLLNAGYLKPCNGAKKDKFGAELVNMEIRNIFSRYAKRWLEKQQPAISTAIAKFVGCLLSGDAEGVSAALNDDLLNNPSCHDFNDENSYHMFIYGMLLAVSDGYTVHSNPETGKGRSDILIKPMDKEKHAAAIEFKHVRGDGKDLKAEALKGLEQIDKKAYVHKLKTEGYKRIHKYGIAFHKKNCEVVMDASGL